MLMEKEKIEIIKFNYENTKKSLREISELSGCSTSSVHRIVKKLALKKPDPNFIKKLNSDLYFKELSYWLGFLYADGSIHKTKVKVGLNSKDRDHLIKLKNFFEVGNIYDYQSHCKKYPNKLYDTSEYAVTNKRLSEKLIELGILKNKTYNDEILIPRKYLNKDFFRGLIDGDGQVSIYGKRKRIILVGSKKMCTEFKNFCKTHVDSKTEVLKHSTIYKYGVYGKNAKTIGDVLYKNSSLHLERKFQSYKMF